MYEIIGTLVVLGFICLIQKYGPLTRLRNKNRKLEEGIHREATLTKKLAEHTDRIRILREQNAPLVDIIAEFKKTLDDVGDSDDPFVQDIKRFVVELEVRQARLLALKKKSIKEFEDIVNGT